MVELLGRVIRREIVNGNPIKLQRLDALVLPFNVVRLTSRFSFHVRYQEYLQRFRRKH